MTKDRLDEECVLLETRDESPMTQLTGTRTVHEMRLENISKSVREVEHKSHGDLNLETGDAVSGQSKSRRILAEHVRETDTAGNMVPADGKFRSDTAGDNHKASEIQEQRLANVSRLITMGSEANPHPREQGGVRHCRLQAGKAQSSPHQRGVLRRPARPLVVQVSDSVIHVPHQGGRCWFHSAAFD